MMLRLLMLVSQSCSRRCWPVLPGRLTSEEAATSIWLRICSSAVASTPGLLRKLDRGLALAFQFLDQVALEISAARHVENLEHGDERDMMRRCLALSEKEFEPIKQVFKPEQGTDALVEGVLVKNQSGIPQEEVRQMGDIISAALDPGLRLNATGHATDFRGF